MIEPISPFRQAIADFFRVRPASPTAKGLLPSDEVLEHAFIELSRQAREDAERGGVMSP